MRIGGQDLQNPCIISKTIIDKQDSSSSSSSSSSLLNFFLPLTAMEVLLSEDYTRVTNYHPTPKITHSFYNFTLEYHYCPRDDRHFNITIGRKNNKEQLSSSFFQHLASRTLELSDLGISKRGCSACKKKLMVGDLVFFYRKGIISFCSFECVAVEVLVEEITKAAINKFSFHGTPAISTATANCFTFFMDLI